MYRTLQVGDCVAVRNVASEHYGRVGAVCEISGDEPMYIVSFGRQCELAFFADELQRMSCGEEVVNAIR